ncbi:hypothetical protein BKA62DRAFT_715737, partial [Auriculariales sp. MPI-PUGE-AT-0066]
MADTRIEYALAPVTGTPSKVSTNEESREIETSTIERDGTQASEPDATESVAGAASKTKKRKRSKAQLTAEEIRTNAMCKTNTSEMTAVYRNPKGYAWLATGTKGGAQAIASRAALYHGVVELPAAAVTTPVDPLNKRKGDLLEEDRDKSPQEDSGDDCCGQASSKRQKLKV